MSDGQATSPDDGIDGIAALLEENSEDENLTGEPGEPGEPGEGAEEATNDPADESDDDSDTAEEQPSLTFKVTVKGEDGADTTVEVDQKELVAGYQRHSDYTRKTQELANREREVTQVVAKKLQEGQQHYMREAQVAQMAIKQLAGLKSTEEMAVLAQTDPAAWVAEQQRERAIQGVLSQLNAGIQQEQAQAQQLDQQHRQQAFQYAWQVLQAEGIDKPQLQKIYQKATENYKIPSEALANLYDPTQVLILRDAIAYRELKANKQAVTQKPVEAQKLPAQRQSVPKDTQRMKEINQRFATGKAKLSDLAALL